MGVELSDPDGRVHSLEVVVDEVFPGVPGARPSEAFDAAIRSGYGDRSPESVLEAVFAFWSASRPEPAETPPPPGAPALPRLRRLVALEVDRYELVLAGDPRSFRVTVGADGTAVSAGPDLREAGETVLLLAAVAELHATRTLGTAGLPPRRPKQARSVAEAAAYLVSLLPPSQRRNDWRRAMQVVRFDPATEGGEAWVRFHRPPADDGGGPTVVDVHVPAGFDSGSWNDRYLSYGRGRSTLLDAGQWLDVEQRQASMAADLAGEAEDQGMTARRYNDILRCLRHAGAAADELAKLLTPDADAIPDSAVWTAESRVRRRISPELFERSRIETARAEYRDAIDAHIARHRRHVR